MKLETKFDRNKIIVNSCTQELDLPNLLNLWIAKNNIILLYSNVLFDGNIRFVAPRLT